KVIELVTKAPKSDPEDRKKGSEKGSRGAVENDRDRKRLNLWRCHPDLNWGMVVLQTTALPLGYGTEGLSSSTITRCAEPPSAPSPPGSSLGPPLGIRFPAGDDLENAHGVDAFLALIDVGVMCARRRATQTFSDCGSVCPRCRALHRGMLSPPRRE